MSANRTAITNYPYYHYIWRPNSIVTRRSIRTLLDKQLALLERVKILHNTEFSGACSQYYYAYCIDFMIEMFQKEWIDTEKASCSAFIDRFLSSKNLFWHYIPWHQKLCVCLVATKNKAILRWLARSSFAPGKKTILLIKARLSQ